MEVRFQRSVAVDKDVHPEVKLLSANEERFFYVATDDIVFGEAWLFYLLHFRCGRPLFELGQFVYKEDAFALGAVSGFHDPGHIG